MRFLEAFQEKAGFTRKEAVAVATLSSVLLVGTGIRWLAPKEGGVAPAVRAFDYSRQDSIFAERSRTAQESAARIPQGESGSRKLTDVKALPKVVNINLATKAQLMSLPGIGEAYAERIIQYRTLNGKFNSIEGLLNVKGIGKKKLEKLRPFVRVR